MIERIQKATPIILVAGVALLALSVLIQLITCVAMFRLNGQMEARDKARDAAAAENAPTRRKPMPVAVTNQVSVSEPVDVRVGNKVDVNLQDHYIIDPIPVRIER